MIEHQGKITQDNEAKDALDKFYKILTGHSMDDEKNPVIKEHFIAKCKQIVLEVISMRVNTATNVIKSGITVEKLKELSTDAIKKIKEYETSKEE